MFQYTSETIINSNEGGLNGKRFAKVGNQLVIDGVTNVKIADIKHVYHTPYAPAVFAKATIAIPTATAGDVLRLRILLSEQGNSRSILQNAYLRKQKPYTYEIISSGVAATDAKAFEKVMKEALAETDFKLFTVSCAADALTIEGTDEYIRFANDKGVALSAGTVGGVELFRIDPPTPANPHLVGNEGVVSLVKGNVVKMGSQGAGTVKRLIKDLRIPTSAKIDPLSLRDGGMPIPGGKYDQYLIEVETTRRNIAGGVVGSINESLTSFVLFIESGIKADWNTLLTTTCGLTVEEAGPQASRSDVKITVDPSTGEVTLEPKK